MNILFLTLVEINSIEERGIYTDLLRKFRNEGHSITIVTPQERRKNISTNLQQKEGVSILQVKTLNIQKTNVIEKGIGTLAIEYQYLSAIKQYLSNQKFDLILYSTPPITLVKPIEYIKKRDNAYAYLLLKDIFPQNAIDLEMLKKGGFLHRFFEKKEKKLYQVSDTIGCMSQANVDFIIRHNPEIPKQKVEENPNSIEPRIFDFSEQEKNEIRRKYNLPIGKKILVYGGNLGKPQGIDFLLDTIISTKDENVFFLIVGNGTEYTRIKQWFKNQKPNNALLLQGLPKNDYDVLLASCDVGLIFLDKNFKIPNFPSRLLSYLEMKMPVITATDPNTDIGKVIEKAGCGYGVLWGDREQMQEKITKITQEDDIKILSENAYQLLNEQYLVERSYNLVVKKCIKK